MNEHTQFSGAHLLIAFLAGAATGAAVAILTAPHSGRETREAVRDWAREKQERVERVPHAVHSAYTEAVRAAREAFVAALERESGAASEETSAGA